MYRVGVIGLGSIAAMYETPESKYPYCHVGGIRLSEKVELAAVADISIPVRQRFEDVWGPVFPELRYYSSGAEMLASNELDIVAVCVRGPFHHQVVMEVLRAKPKAIFLEKPPTCSLNEMDEIVAVAKREGIPITVSYSRHWAPKVLRVAELVREGIIGEVQTVVGYTSAEGILSFTSHTTDLICQFAGYNPVSVSARGTVPKNDVPDGYEPEPMMDGKVLIEFENGVTGVQIGGEGEHGGFYCDVFGTKGSAQVGIYIDPVLRDSKNNKLDLSEFSIPENKSVFTVAYDQIADYLDGGPLPECTNDPFIAVHEIGFAAIESITTNQKIVLPNQNRSRKVFANG